MYAIILNYETGTVEALDLCNKPKKMDNEQYIEEILEYSLFGCEWMTTKEKPEILFLN